MRLLVVPIALAMLAPPARAQYQPLPTFESVTFTRLADPAGYIQVVVRGRGMTGDWEVRGATAGRAELLAVVPFPDGKGLVGLLPPEPPDGSEVMIRASSGARASLVSTGAYFRVDAVKGAPRAPLDSREDCAFPVVPGRSIGPLRLGMKPADLTRLGAKLDPENDAWHHLGPITTMTGKSGTVELLWIERPTMCLVEGKKRMKLDVPRGSAESAPFPYPDCPYPTETSIGGACWKCADRGLEVCVGSSGWYASTRVAPAKR